MRADVALDCACRLGEGPVWDDQAQRLLFVDILAGRVHAWAPGSAPSTLDLGGHVGCVALTDDPSRLVVALNDGVAIVDDGGTAVATIVVDAARERRFNDGQVDSRGRLWFGSMGYRPTPGTAALYRWDGASEPSVAIAGVGLSNGLGWAPNDSALYYIDTLTHAVAVYAFDSASGTIGERIDTVDLPFEWGDPDGMTVDREGNLWIAFWGGFAVRCISPTGELLDVVDVPTRQVTSCAFGGSDLDTLFITSAWDGLSPLDRVEDPRAGHVFAVRPGTSGRAAARMRLPTTQPVP